MTALGLLKQHVQVLGESVHVGGLERGPLLVSDDVVLYDRYRSYIRSQLEFKGVPLAVITMVIILVNIVAPSTIVITIVLLFIGLMTWAAAEKARRDLERGGPFPGVFTCGIQMITYPVRREHHFIPWREIRDVNYTLDGSVPQLELHLHNSTRKWTVSGLFWTPQEIQTIMESVMGGSGPTSLPEAGDGPPLNLYTQAGRCRPDLDGS
jgi:hypothetical protein